MSMGDKRWSVGKNDIDRDNRLLNRDPNLSSYVPSDDSTGSNYSKRNVRRKTFAVLGALGTFLIFYFGGQMLPIKLYDNLWFLLISLLMGFIVYRFAAVKRRI